MKKRFFALSALSLILVGCDNQQDAKVNAEQSVAVTEPSTELSAAQPSADDTIHNARNSLDWAGLYQGTLPCADCVGIETQLTLNADETYTLTEKYLETESEPISSQGTFTWNEIGNIVTLQPNEQATRQYWVSENTLTHLDMYGQKIDGELAPFYVLNKQ